MIGTDTGYDHKEIEKKWQKRWEEDGIYRQAMDKAEKPYFNLMMFPYPSAEGLHVGNMYAFTGSDIWGRLKAMQGYNVFEPMGLDGFGIHSENYAIKIGEHIRDVSQRTEKHFYEQLRMIGNRFDWSRTVETYKPNYYRWTQWLFVQMFRHGLAYRKKATVNWCPSCKTVLADEQVEGGRCERCKSETTTKDMEQWFWRITDYAEKLLKNLEWINWSEEVKLGQKNWIGKSEGAELEFRMSAKGADRQNLEFGIKVFTTRPDTLFGATFMVLAPEHKLVANNELEIKNYEEVKKYIKQVKKKSDIERTDLNKDKTGVKLEGVMAINPVTNEEIPVFVADYVLMEYGEGAIMGVPGHDERDFEFARKYGLLIKQVVDVEGEFSDKEWYGSYLNDGSLVNSGEWNGWRYPEDLGKVLDWLEDKKIGKRSITYKLRDWCVSRQRYWGAPIPMVFCKQCNWQPVEEKDLPVLLPDIADFEDVLPDGSGEGPLARQKDFVNVKCPKCGNEARRETDVMDPFVDSSWYFYRYTSTEFDKVPFDKERGKKWLPVDMYIGGKEHTVLHLLYSRFITMALKDFGYIDFEEPYERFFGHGLLIKEGAKMSKSKGNVINPDEYIGNYGADAVRMYLMFLGNFEQGGDWQDNGMRGMHRFVKRIYSVTTTILDAVVRGELEVKNGMARSIHACVDKVTKDIERLSYNTAIAQLMIFFNGRDSKPDWRPKVSASGDFETVSDIGLGVDLEAFRKFLLVLAPFAPHMAEELWQRLIGSHSGGSKATDRISEDSENVFEGDPIAALQDDEGRAWSVHQQRWPEYDKGLLVEEDVEIPVQVNGKLRFSINIKNQKSKIKNEVEELAMEDERVKKWVHGQKVKRVIFVPGKLVNIVTAEPKGHE